MNTVHSRITFSWHICNAQRAAHAFNLGFRDVDDFAHALLQRCCFSTGAAMLHIAVLTKICDRLNEFGFILPLLKTSEKNKHPRSVKIRDGSYCFISAPACAALICVNVSSQLGISGTDLLTRRHFSRPTGPMR